MTQASAVLSLSVVVLLVTVVVAAHLLLGSGGRWLVLLLFLLPMLCWLICLDCPMFSDG